MPATPHRALYIAFAGMGATASLIPASLPSLADGLAVSTEVVLPAVPMLFAGLLLGVVLTPLLISRVTSAAVVRIGAAVQFCGLGVIAIAAAPWMVLLGAALAGIGFGFVEAGGTMLARQFGQPTVTRLLSLLTATVSVVAVVGPLLVVAAGALGVERAVLALAAILQLTAALLVRSDRAVAPAQSTRRTPFVRGLIPLGIALFLYVGIESVLSGWSAATVESDLGTTATLAAVGTSAFWALMTLGRLFGLGVLARHPHPRALGLGAVALVAGGLISAVAVASLSSAATLLLLAVAVFACGPCYALLVGAAVETMTAHRSAMGTSTLIAIGAIGGIVIPLLVLLAGGPGSGLWVAASFAALAVVVLAATRPWRIAGPMPGGEGHP